MLKSGPEPRGRAQAAGGGASGHLAWDGPPGAGGRRRRRRMPARAERGPDRPAAAVDRAPGRGRAPLAGPRGAKSVWGCTAAGGGGRCCCGGPRRCRGPGALLRGPFKAQRGGPGSPRPPGGWARSGWGCRRPPPPPLSLPLPG